MRKELAKQEGLRKKFSATVSRFGAKVNYNGYKEETILLKNIIDLENNKRVAEHVWFTYTKGFQEARLKEGSVIEFEARVKQYTKGYVNRRYGINNKSTDYKLSHPTKISVVSA